MSRSIKPLPIVALLGALLASSADAGFAQQAEASAQLERLFAEAWEFALQENPLFATQVGDRRYNDRLPSVTVSDYQRRLVKQLSFLQRLDAIDKSSLSESERTSYDIFKRLGEDQVGELEFRSYLIPITNRNGFHVSFPQLPRRVPLRTVEDYENYIARLNAFSTYAQQHIDLMRIGVREGYTLPGVVLEGYEDAIDPHIVDEAAQSLLFEPFQGFPETIPPEDRERLTEAGIMAITESVVPGYRAFGEFMRAEYYASAREEIGASALPNGRAYYEHRVRRFTTLDDRTPEEVHQIGLTEVARIRGGMDEIIAEVGFEGDFEAFVRFLRTDPRFYVETPEELMEKTARVLKKMDGQLPRLFGALPRMPYGMRPVPDFIAPKTTTAYYNRPAGDGTQAGFYYINTYDLSSRPLYEIEALSLHEAVPGHHLQIALQQELEGLPDFRRFAGFTAFVEGWALYAERLGLEVGFYEDPYSNFGRLTYEMWRACRLVVDPGMHYLGWTRQQAIDFMAENSALSLHNITTEVDRYIAWPGQAVAYKTGELKIRELRERAELQLGDRFDVREFHDVVLGSGSVPLSVLESNVEEYIATASRTRTD
ncbi:MAG: DUF885 domain-containing protein [Gemmatimonadota bacterium]